ncbi:MAG: hypothetical protein WBM01_19985, partial [Mycobacterium sp.]
SSVADITVAMLLLVTLAAVPVTDGVAIPTEREYCALRGMALPRWSSRSQVGSHALTRKAVAFTLWPNPSW